MHHVFKNIQDQLKRVESIHDSNEKIIERQQAIIEKQAMWVKDLQQEVRSLRLMNKYLQL